MSGLEERLERIARERGPDAAWDSMSLGAGRELEPKGEGCPGSEDGKHRYRAVSCVQSVEHFVCQNSGCESHYYD